MSDIENLISEFKQPDSKFRSIPFWAWDDNMDENEVINQIKSMHEQGVGGFFIHSREGLEIEYMGEKWNSLVKIAVEQAKQFGMQAWLYDEDRWPSGTAGGKLAKKYGDKARCKGITLEVCNNIEQINFNEPNIIQIYHAKISNMQISDLEIYRNDEEHFDETLLIARIEISEKCEWFNNEAPPDNLNSDIVKCFIDETHEKYKQLVGDEFGKTVPGIFTDEPNLSDKHAKFNPNRGWIPWTTDFAGYFAEKRGYSLIDFIPYIYFNGKLSNKIRHDYWRTVSEKFAEAYSKNIGEWCKKNNLAYTGHFLQEDRLGLCTRANGSIMPHYKYQDVPGIDILEEKTDEYLTVKQCASVANQYGKPVVLSETYGGAGWEFSFEAQKWMGDWQYALGVNRRSQHIMLYSLRGCRKRDYPPCFNYNNMWWKHNKVTEDYFARLSAVLSKGRAIRDILILHPASTAWAMLGTSPYGNPVRSKERDVPLIDKIGYRYNDLLCYLSGIHYDYDLGDEQLMAEDAVVNNNILKLGIAEYKLIIMPPMITMLASTLKILQSYMDNGGKIISMLPQPDMLEGERSQQVDNLMKHKNMLCAENESILQQIIKQLLPRVISITDKYGDEDKNILAIIKDLGDRYVLFAVNNDRYNSHEVNINLLLKGELEEWFPLTGKRDIHNCKITQSGISFSENFNCTDSHLYIISKNKKAIETIDKLNYKYTLFKQFSPVCTVTRTQPNVITLDKCRYSLNNEAFSELMPVWKAQSKIREQLGMRQIYQNGLMQRYLWAEQPHLSDGQKVCFIFNFTVKELPFTDSYLVVESAKNYEITVNGEKILSEVSGWFADRSFDKVLLPKLKSGVNVIELACLYKNSMEVEDCYIIGDFAVNTNREIVNEKETIRTGDWTLQGYFHYCGSLIYNYTFKYKPDDKKRLIIKIDKFIATALCVNVNGHLIEMPWKAAAEADITDYVTDGDNKIGVEVISGMRNMLGPLHLSCGKDKMTNSASFRSTGDNETYEYQVVGYGLFTPPKLIIKISER